METDTDWFSFLAFWLSRRSSVFTALPLPQRAGTTSGLGQDETKGWTDFQM